MAVCDVLEGEDLTIVDDGVVAPEALCVRQRVLVKVLYADTVARGLHIQHKRSPLGFLCLRVIVASEHQDFLRVDLHSCTKGHELNFRSVPGVLYVDHRPLVFPRIVPESTHSYISIRLLLSTRFRIPPILKM